MSDDQVRDHLLSCLETVQQDLEAAKQHSSAVMVEQARELIQEQATKLDRLQRIKDDDSAEFRRLDKALDELQGENAELWSRLVRIQKAWHDYMMANMFSRSEAEAALCRAIHDTAVEGQCGACFEPADPGTEYCAEHQPEPYHPGGECVLESAAEQQQEPVYDDFAWNEVTGKAEIRSDVLRMDGDSERQEQPAYARLYDEKIPPHPFEDFTEKTGYCIRCGEPPAFHLHAVTTASESLVTDRDICRICGKLVRAGHDCRPTASDRKNP